MPRFKKKKLTPEEKEIEKQIKKLPFFMRKKVRESYEMFMKGAILEVDTDVDNKEKIKEAMKNGEVSGKVQEQEPRD